LTAPAQPTEPDLRVGLGTDFWFVVYRDIHGNLCKAKMTDAHLRRRIRAGKLSGRAKVARSPKGPFEAVQACAALREDLQAAPAPPERVQAPAPTVADPLTRWWWMLALTLIVSILTLLILVYFVTRQ
jgi:hypothetical protein